VRLNSSFIGVLINLSRASLHLGAIKVTVELDSLKKKVKIELHSGSKSSAVLCIIYYVIIQFFIILLNNIYLQHTL
jgi:hypothetical protein